MRHALFRLSLCAAVALPVQANAYCADLQSLESIPKDYRSLAPLYGSDGTGWIFVSNQFEERFEIEPKALSLLADIAGIFAERDIPLAIMMPPSRPVIAGEAVLEATSGGMIEFDADRASASFSRMVDVVNRTGIIMPDLQAIVLDDPRLRDAYYFRRDTHWTPIGAAASAIIMSRAVEQRHPGLFPDAGSVRPSMGEDAELLEEPGSLSKVVGEICERAPDPEVVKIPHYPSSGASLFGDEPSRPRIALMGTSFSNGRQRDAYRVADALAGAFQADVENYSVSGGGMIAAVEVFMLAEELDEERPDLVIWEIPFSDAFGSVDGFRQIKGALLLPGAAPTGVKADLDASGRTVLFPTVAADLVVVNTPVGSPDEITVTATFSDGSVMSADLRRKGHFPADWRLERAATSIGDPNLADLVRVEITYDPETAGPGAGVELYSSSPSTTALVSR